MKKILFGTTALVGAALLSTAATAESPKVTVGGFLDFQAGWADDDFDSTGAPGDDQRNYGFRNDTEISFKIDGVTDSGLKYGGEISLEADVDADSSASGGSSDADSQGINASKTYLYLEGSWGRFEGGSNVGADATLKVDASNIARATGGIDGAFTYFNNGGGGLAPGYGYIATPDLPMNYGNLGSAQGDETTENANKITYYTPRWNGLQGGVSYAPDQVNRGQFVSRIDTGAPATSNLGSTVADYENIWQAGLVYDTTYQGFGIGLGATGEWGNANLNTQEDLRAWQLGAKVTYMGFSIAGSYADTGGAGSVDASNTDSDFWTLGAAYEWGPFGTSVTYLSSKVDPSGALKHKFNNLSVGADWKLAPGFTPYIEASWFEYDSDVAADDNDGTVVIVGSQLAF